ncbi:hypothetical protein [Aeromonas hydrophila]|uniref:hypothetical protein n=2 Tax=Aeromonas hydrophila TaxID=644 RepID=UPI0005D7EE2A|nr:hypothetical protein [Aeromonas hydrophila]AKA17277.1 hypothetical protein VU14_10530 [Aeromonas hydrophila]
MKYDELQAIANAIIDSNDRLILLNLIILLFSIAGIYCAAFIKKKAELEAINKNFQDIADQNRAITTDTELIKNQLSKGTIEYQIRLSRYHEKQINAIEKIYEKLAILFMSSKKIILMKDDGADENFNSAVTAFRENFEIEKLWLDASISNEIEEFAIEIDKQVKLFQGATFIAGLKNLNESQIAQAYDKQDNFYKFTVSTSNALKNKLESQLRSYLSPEKST